MKLVKDIVPFHMSHNAEPEAVDLLIEVEKLEYLIDHVTENNYSRTCLYLISCSSYLPEPEDGIVLSTAHKIFMKVNKLCDAMRVALKLGVQSTIEETFLASKDPLEKETALLHSRPTRSPVEIRRRAVRTRRRRCRRIDVDHVKLEALRKLFDFSERLGRDGSQVTRRHLQNTFD